MRVPLGIRISIRTFFRITKASEGPKLSTESLSLIILAVIVVLRDGRSTEPATGTDDEDVRCYSEASRIRRLKIKQLLKCAYSKKHCQLWISPQNLAQRTCIVDS